jgi:hypothetical protein
LSAPNSLNRDSLLDRARRIRAEILRGDPGVPSGVAHCVHDIVACLEDPQQDLQHLSPCAHEILHWYFDQGSKEVPLHAELSALALDIAKLAEAT